MSPKIHRTSPKIHRTSPQMHKTSPKTHITSPHHCRCPCCPWCYQHWPVLHEGAGLFIQLLPLPCSFLSSSRADPSKMHFRWRRDSLLGASNLCQVCFYWLQEHTDAGKADRLQHLMSLLSPQNVSYTVRSTKKKESNISTWKGDTSSSLILCYCFCLPSLWYMGSPLTRDGSPLAILISSLTESRSYQVFHITLSIRMTVIVTFLNKPLIFH